MFGALLCAVLTLPTVALAQPQGPPPQAPPIVVTTGEGIVKAAPDRAWVTIAAESRAKGPREAQKLNTDAMSAVLQKLKGAGLEADAIRTASYDLQPEFDYNNGRQTLRGYVARNSVEVRVDEITRVGEILALAVGSGATSVSGVRFDLKNRDALELDALQRAVADARRRAEAAAKGAGMTVAGVLRIDEHRAGAPDPRMVMTRQSTMLAVGAESAVPVSPGELEVRVMVTVTSAIR